MLNQSFIFLKGVSNKKEKNIWDQGINNWQEYHSEKIKGISDKTKFLHLAQMKKTQEAIENYDETHFCNNFPSKESWRHYNLFKDDTLYLDIETDGWNITVIGLYNGEYQNFLIRNKNMDRDLFQKIINNCKQIVTFNGKSFDIPNIEKYFRIKIQKPHIDLMHVCRKINLTGGLKKIENEIGINRPETIKTIKGDDAILLWQLYRHTGKQTYLEQLLGYNEQDCVNLKTLAEYTIPKVWDQIRKA